MGNYESPKCAACELGKGHCWTNKVNEINNNTMKDQELNKDHLMPVHMVYSDHYISWDAGRLYHTKGKLYPSYIY